jgi:hypothetical protein
MNTFFGAVLGFVMAGTERLDSLEFALLLMFVAGIVISILYVSASKQKVVYSLLTITLIWMLPGAIEPALEAGEGVPAKLQATLLVWTLMAISVEFLPRRADDDETASQPVLPTALSGKSEPNTL